MEAVRRKGGLPPHGGPTSRLCHKNCLGRWANLFLHCSPVHEAKGFGLVSNYHRTHEHAVGEYSLDSGAMARVLNSYKYSAHLYFSSTNMATPSSSESPPSLSDKTIQILKALHEHAFETMDIEYPWYMLWNECFTQLNMLYSDNDIHLTVGPQQQFTKRKHRKLSSAPGAFPIYLY